MKHLLSTYWIPGIGLFLTTTVFIAVSGDWWWRQSVFRIRHTLVHILAQMLLSVETQLPHLHNWNKIHMSSIPGRLTEKIFAQRRYSANVSCSPLPFFLPLPVLFPPFLLLPPILLLLHFLLPVGIPSTQSRAHSDIVGWSYEQRRGKDKEDWGGQCGVGRR